MTSAAVLFEKLGSKLLDSSLIRFYAARPQLAVLETLPHGGEQEGPFATDAATGGEFTRARLFRFLKPAQ